MHDILQAVFNDEETDDIDDEDDLDDLNENENEGILLFFHNSCFLLLLKNTKNVIMYGQCL